MGRLHLDNCHPILNRNDLYSILWKLNLIYIQSPLPKMCNMCRLYTSAWQPKEEILVLLQQVTLAQQAGYNYRFITSIICKALDYYTTHKSLYFSLCSNNWTIDVNQQGLSCARLSSKACWSFFVNCFELLLLTNSKSRSDWIAHLLCAYRNITKNC